MAKKEKKRPFVSGGLIQHSVEGLEANAGFGQPGLTKFRTDIDNEVATGIIDFTRPDGSKSPGVLKRFLRGAEKP